MPSNLARLKLAIPSGIEGPDGDGAFVYFGPDPSWTPDKEGQPVAKIPRVGRKVHHDRAICPTCGGVCGIDRMGDDRKTCAGCLRSGQDGWLDRELDRDKARKVRAKDAPADKIDENDRTAEAVKPGSGKKAKGRIVYANTAQFNDHQKRMRAKRRVPKS